MTVTALHPQRMEAAARGDLAEQAADQAQELAFLVRDEGPAAITAWLDRHRIPQDTETRLLVVALAAMVDIDATTDAMLAWVTWDEYGQPLPGTSPPPAGPAPLEVPARFYEDCGTMRAYWRHRAAGHPKTQTESCGCGQAQRDYYASRYKARKDNPVAVVSPRSQTEVKVAEYERLTRVDKVPKADAAARLGISERTACRYEARLKDRAGQEPADAAA